MKYAYLPRMDTSYGAPTSSRAEAIETVHKIDGWQNISLRK